MEVDLNVLSSLHNKIKGMFYLQLKLNIKNHIYLQQNFQLVT